MKIAFIIFDQMTAVTWSEDEKKYMPIDSEGWQFTQMRGVTSLSIQARLAW